MTSFWRTNSNKSTEFLGLERKKQLIIFCKFFCNDLNERKKKVCDFAKKDFREYQIMELKMKCSKNKNVNEEIMKELIINESEDNFVIRF